MLQELKSYVQPCYAVSGTDINGVKYFKGEMISFLADEVSKLKFKPSYKRVEEGNKITISYIEPTYHKDLDWVDAKVDAAIKAIEGLNDKNILRNMLLTGCRNHDTLELKRILGREYLENAPEVGINESKTIIIEKIITHTPIIEL